MLRRGLITLRIKRECLAELPNIYRLQKGDVFPVSARADRSLLAAPPKDKQRQRQEHEVERQLDVWDCVEGLIARSAML